MARVIRHMTSESSSNIIQIPTAGTPLTFVCVTKARSPERTSSRTLKRHLTDVQSVREVITAGNPNPVLQRK
ncbi:hypothetical protein EMCRGX_G028145 [Ephydatia muelleri]